MKVAREPDGRRYGPAIFRIHYGGHAYQPHLAAGTFPRYAAAHNVGRCGVALDPGDLYFFNTRLVHEVPAVEGRDPRVVLAAFIGFTPGDDEIFVWA